MAKRGYTYEWPRPGVTVDIALFTVAGALNALRLQVLLIERDEPPWRGMWEITSRGRSGVIQPKAISAPDVLLMNGSRTANASRCDSPSKA